MEARPPESEHIMPRRIFKSRAYQLAHEPESLVMIARSGKREDNSQVTRCGLMGFAEVSARASSTCHHSDTPFSILVRQLRSDLRSSSGSSARNVSALSPTRFTSMG